MFETIDEQMRQDDERETTPKQRLVKWLLVGAVSALLFFGLYFGFGLLGAP